MINLLKYFLKIMQRQIFLLKIKYSILREKRAWDGETPSGEARKRYGTDLMDRIVQCP